MKSSWEVTKRLNQDTTIIGLPVGCVGHVIHFTSYRETNIIALGKMFQPSYLPEIQIWLASGYSRLIESRKNKKVCNINRQDDVARFSGNEL